LSPYLQTFKEALKLIPSLAETISGLHKRLQMQALGVLLPEGKRLQIAEMGNKICKQELVDNTVLWY
jgi:hypothetical protein